MRYLHFMGLLLAFPMSILYGSLNGKIDKNNLSLNSVKEELSKININENVVLLCLLVAISLILLFLLIRIFNQKRKLEHSLKSHKIKEQSQNKFLSDISQKVYKEAKELDKEEKPIIQKIKDENPTKYEKIKELKVALLKNSKELTYFLKLKTNRLEAKLQDFNLEELLTQLVDEIYEQHPKKELDLIFIIEPEIPQNLIGDPQRIYTILHTLIENAIEESTNNSNGEIVVDIRLCKDQKSSSTQIITLCFKIATPISKELKEVIENNFEPYYDDSKNRYIGVHLSFAKDLLDGISGEIWLEKEDKNQFISFKIIYRF
ncbi:MAG: HAMP domain-containing histidine kinase, partial [Epsilonproteobacteria bacterium]|nr:HAMP domain-containing histidine kinase [Campylobacterota bacterium]